MDCRLARQEDVTPSLRAPARRQEAGSHEGTKEDEARGKVSVLRLLVLHKELEQNILFSRGRASQIPNIAPFVPCAKARGFLSAALS